MAGDEPRDDKPDPVRAARGAGQPPRAKRFYKTVATAPVEGGHGVTLDGRPVRMPSRAVLAVPTAPLAEALAAEWASQGELIEPTSMPLTRLVNSALDGVAGRIEETAEEIVKYAGSDLLFYRADGPSSLVARQAAHWDPVLDFMRERLGARFVLSKGIRYVEQPPSSVAAVRAALPQDALRLAALASMTALAGSALLVLGVWLGALDEEAAWTAAHVDEDHQIELWGLDAEAAARREARRREFAAAAALLRHLA
jgi:chaperone required for assembly of F1-ATPase